MIRRRNKYHAVGQRVAGRYFASTLEAERGAELALMEQSWEQPIRDLRYQHAVELAGCVNYHADFSYTELPTERFVFEEAKGVEDKRWAVIQQLWPVWGSAPLLVSKRRGRGIEVVKTILPDLQRRRAFLLEQLALLDTGGA